MRKIFDLVTWIKFFVFILGQKFLVAVLNFIQNELLQIFFSSNFIWKLHILSMGFWMLCVCVCAREYLGFKRCVEYFLTKMLYINGSDYLWKICIVWLLASFAKHRIICDVSPRKTKFNYNLINSCSVCSDSVIWKWLIYQHISEKRKHFQQNLMNVAFKRVFISKKKKKNS